jgi:hypothetical protein
MGSHSLHPELFGAPEEKGVEWVRNLARMRHVKELRTKKPRRSSE